LFLFLKVTVYNLYNTQDNIEHSDQNTASQTLKKFKYKTILISCLLQSNPLLFGSHWHTYKKSKP